MKRIFILITLFTSLINAQEVENKLDSITDIASAEKYLKENKSKENRLVTFNEEKHHTVLAQDLFNKGVGGQETIINSFEKTTYKVIEKNKVIHYRVSYILLDAKKTKPAQIQPTINQIIADYNSGTPFSFLSKKYSNATNAGRGGDSGWFTKEEIPLFVNVDITESQYLEKALYTLENDVKGYYYVILNTNKPKEINELKVLKIVEPRT